MRGPRKPRVTRRLLRRNIASYNKLQLVRNAADMRRKVGVTGLSIQCTSLVIGGAETILVRKGNPDLQPPRRSGPVTPLTVGRSEPARPPQVATDSPASTAE